jgi:hypothetical protein
LINHDRAMRGLYPFAWNPTLAGPSNPPWANIYAVQESMINEPPTGWHRIHLTSTTLHRIGVGLYIDPNGWVWFTQDMMS